MNPLDRAIAAVSPERALRRETARARLQVVASTSDELTRGHRSETRWRGASRMLRAMSAWIPGLTSGRSDLPASERRTMVARSHDAYRNHLIARAVITRMRTNVVGTGLMAYPSVDAKTLGISETEADELNELIGRQWNTWADNPNECDVEGTLDFAGQQSLALISSMLSGDAFGMTPWVEHPGGMWGLKLQLVDAARVSNPNMGPDTDTLIDGVEIDRVGRPLRYWMQRRHPADHVVGVNDMFRWDPVPVFGAQTGRRRVMHVWSDKDRIGAVRGAPLLAPILEPLQQIETLGRAELMGSVIAALFTVFIEHENQQTDELGNPIGTLAGEPEDDGGNVSMGSGAVVDLEPGAKPHIANPTRPNDKYDPFFLSIVKQIGAAVEIPLDELLLAYNSSYSAARAAMLQAWRMYVMRRWQLTQQLCMPVRLLWFDEAVARGRIPVTGYADPIRRAAYTAAMWVGPARGSMDELKEAQAAEKRIQIGVSNETIETAAMTGEDWRTVHEQRVRERRRMVADRLPRAGGRAVQPPPAPQPEPPQES